MNEPNHQTNKQTRDDNILRAFESGDFFRARELLSEVDVRLTEEDRLYTVAQAVKFDGALIGVAMAMASVWISAFLYFT